MSLVHLHFTLILPLSYSSTAHLHICKSPELYFTSYYWRFFQSLSHFPVNIPVANNNCENQRLLQRLAAPKCPWMWRNVNVKKLWKRRCPKIKLVTPPHVAHINYCKQVWRNMVHLRTNVVCCHACTSCWCVVPVPRVSISFCPICPWCWCLAFCTFTSAPRIIWGLTFLSWNGNCISLLYLHGFGKCNSTEAKGSPVQIISLTPAYL